MDDRSRLLLKTLIEQYIGDGQPVGSRTLSKTSGLELSAATIRNVMADLEEMGLIASPHTSAGRIPTARGYRLFVDTMLTAEPTPLDSLHLQQLQHLQITADQPQKVIGHAAQLLSNLSNFVGVVLAPKRSTVFRHIEFLRLSERRIVVIIVSPDGDVQNRVIHTAQDYTQSQLIEASNFLCSHYAGRTIEEVRARLQTEVEGLRTEITALMQAAVAQDGALEEDAPEQVVVSGERKLLAIDDFSHDLNHLRRAFDLFEQKAQLLKLLDTSAHAEGVRIYIGGESQVVPVEELSVVSAPYRVNGMVVGRLGVIGPTRMQYDKMIQIVDVTAKMVENALTLK